MANAGAKVWRFVRQLYRARYAVLTVFVPSLIVLSAWAAPPLLRGLLLVDLTNWHLAWLTWSSAMVVALGLAIYRVIQLHGDARMGHESRQPWSDEISHGSVRWRWDSETIGWPLAPTAVWILASLTYPWAALRATLHELAVGDAGSATFARGALSISLGLFLAASSLFFLALLRTVIVGGKSAGSGLVLGEGLAYWVVSRSHKPLAERRQPLLYFPIHFAGVTDPATKRLLPGHPQLLVALFVSVTVYLLWYYRTVSEDSWVQPDWPVGFYLLLLAYCCSAIFSFLAFILDRYHIPATLTLAVYAGLIADAHRYYELAPAERQPTTELNVTVDAEDNVLSAAIANRNDEPSTRPYLDELYGMDPERHFVFPKWSDGKRTMVVVTASGGGIQAAAWTSQVLTGLDQRSPHISESIGLISAVSGGSAGVMHCLAQRRPRSNNAAVDQLPAYNSEQRLAANRNAQASSLEAVGWGMAFPDFARTMCPFPLNPRIDRGWALEASWWDRLGSGPGESAMMQDLRIRDLIYPIRSGRMPPVIFNATSVETGQRVMISPVHTEAIQQGKTVDYENVHSPIDLLDYYGKAVVDPRRINPRLTTAVRLSATFAYVTPVARPLPLAREAVDDEHQSRFQMHLCDGGYADNTGLVAAIRLVHDLIVQYHTKMDEDPSFEPPFERVIFVRIEPFPDNAVKIMRDGTGLKGALLGPVAALAATRTSTQAERADLELALLMDLSAGTLAAEQDELAVLNSQRRALEKRLASMNLTSNSYAKLRGAVEGFSATATRLAVKGASRAELESQLRRVQEEANQLSDDQSAAIVAAAEDFRKNTEPPPSRRRIEVKTVLFRFGAGKEVPPSDADSDLSQHNPPLSWLLAESDVKALGASWKVYEKAFDAAPETVLEAKAEGQPWNASYQQLNVGALHPQIFTNMAENPGANTTN